MSISDIGRTKSCMSSGLDVEPVGFDAGSPEDLFKAARYMRNRQKQTGKLIGCPEEAAYRKGWIGWRELEWSAGQNRHSLYGKYLIRLMEYA